MQCVLNFTSARWKEKGMLAADEPRHSTSIVTSELRKVFLTAEAETGICGSSLLVSEYDKHRSQFYITSNILLLLTVIFTCIETWNLSLVDLYLIILTESNRANIKRIIKMPSHERNVTCYTRNYVSLHVKMYRVHWLRCSAVTFDRLQGFYWLHIAKWVLLQV